MSKAGMCGGVLERIKQQHRSVVLELNIPFNTATFRCAGRKDWPL